MFVFIEDKDTYNNFNNPLAVKIDLDNLFSSIKWSPIEKEEFRQIHENMLCLTYKNLIFSLFNSLEGSLVIFNKSIIKLIEQFKEADVAVSNLPFNIYEISNHSALNNIPIINLDKLNILIKKAFD